MSYQVVVQPSARRAMHALPEAVVAAIWEFMSGPLAENPRRVGKPLDPPFGGDHVARRGEYRVRYRIEGGEVHVLTIKHRRDAYRR